MTTHPEAPPLPSDRKTVSVVLPAHNEARNLGKRLEDLDGVLEPWGGNVDFIVVSDGSDDGTAKAVTSLRRTNTKVIELSMNFGKGEALRQGIRAARGEIIILTDADNDIAPHSVLTVLYSMSDSSIDAAIGSKAHPLSVVKYPRMRLLQSHLHRKLVKSLFCLPVGDTQTGVKAFRRHILEKCLPITQTTGFEFDIELLMLVSQYGSGIVECPVQIKHKRTSSIRLADSFKLMRGTIRLWRRRRQITTHVF